MRIPSPDLDETLTPRIGAMDIATAVANRLGPRTFDRCFQASVSLWKALRKAGYEANPIQVAGYKPEAPGADARWKRIPQDSWSHYVVQVEGTVYDVTMRQFDQNSPQVAVSTIEDLHRDWDRVYAGEDAPVFT